MSTDSTPTSPMVPGDGPVPCRWLFLGEAPGAMEDRYGIPFIGPAGDILWELAARVHLTRADVHVDNIYPYRPPGNRTPTPSEVRSQHERLVLLLSTVCPTYVVLLGATAIGALLPGTTLKASHGIPVVRDGIVYVPMYHPAACLHNPPLFSVMQKDWDDLPNRLSSLAGVGQANDTYILDNTTVVIQNDTLLALDTETDPDGTLICFSSASLSPTGNLDVRVYTGWEGHPTVKSIQTDTLVMHNAKFDLQILRRAGIAVTYNHLIDTMLTAWTLGEDSLGLKNLAIRHLGMSMTPLRELLAAEQSVSNRAWLGRITLDNLTKGDNLRINKWLQEPLTINPTTKLYTRCVEASGSPPPVIGVRDLPTLYPYNAQDSLATARLHLYQQPLLSPEQRVVLAIEEGCLPALAEMEYQGVLIDNQWLEDHRNNLRRQQVYLRQSIPSDINPNSGPQLAKWLYANHPCTIRTKSGGQSTGKEALTALGTTEADAVLAYRHINDQLEVADSIQHISWNSIDRRIHTNYQQVRVHDDTEDGEGATATGRLSSRDPNLQNITPELRRAFVAKPGHCLISVDYSQIEPRLMAYYAQEESLADGFRHGISPYITVGKQVFKTDIQRDSPQYKLAKILVLGTNYRLTDYGFALRSGLSVAEAGEIIREYMRQFPGIPRYMKECLDFVRNNGYIATFHGRRRYLDINEGERTWRQAVNMPIQGTAAEVMKLALAGVRDAYPILTVHDEIVAEVPKHLTMVVASAIIAVMESAWPSTIGDFVPIEVHASVGDNWKEMTPLDLVTSI